MFFVDRISILCFPQTPWKVTGHLGNSGTLLTNLTESGPEKNIYCIWYKKRYNLWLRWRMNSTHVFLKINFIYYFTSQRQFPLPLLLPFPSSISPLSHHPIHPFRKGQASMGINKVPPLVLRQDKALQYEE